MKKLCITLAVLALLCAAFIIPAAAYTDGEVIYSEDFTDPKYDYTDPNDNYDVVIANGKMELLSFSGDKLYQLPWPAVTGLDKFTVVYDWKVISSANPGSAGHTLYFLFGVKDTKNAIYCGSSHVNGTEHLGTIIDGKWGRQYRNHFQTADLQSKMSAMGTDTFRIKIEVADGVTKVYVNGNRYVDPAKGEGWKDTDQVSDLWYDGGFGFCSRGSGLCAQIDNIAVYAGIDLLIDDMPQMTEDTTPVETTTEAPVETTPVETTPVETTTEAPDVTTPAPTTDVTTPAPADTTTAAGTTEKGGCGSVVALGLIACLMPAAVVICRKKK